MQLDLNGLELDIKIDGKVIPVLPANISVSLSSSIHTPFAQASVEIADEDGDFKEYSTLEAGKSVQIYYGYPNAAGRTTKHLFHHQSDYVTYLSDTEFLPNMRGVMLFQLVHNSYLNQPLVSKGYYDRISNITSKLLNGHKFETVDVDGTGNQDLWIQAMQSDFSFIQDTLRPNAYASDAANTPFYFFINTRNEAYFKNLKNLHSQEPKVASKLIMGSQIIQSNQMHSITGEDSRSLIAIYQMRKLASPLKEQLRGTRKLVSEYNWSTGVQEYTRSNESEYYASKANHTLLGKIPEGFYSVEHQTIFEEYVGANDNNIGQLSDAMRQLYYRERFALVCALQANLVAGDTVQIYLSRFNKPGGLSSFYADKYLIEKAEHVWNRRTSSPYTFLVVSRWMVDLDRSYTKAMKGTLLDPSEVSGWKGTGAQRL